VLNSIIVALMKFCRICFEQDEISSKLISPCNCKGSSLYIHELCLAQWQEVALQSNFPSRASICHICKSYYSYPTRSFLIYRQLCHILKFNVDIVCAVLSLIWLACFVTPLKFVIHFGLIMITVPFGKISLGSTALAWVGNDFPPQLAIIQHSNGVAVPELKAGMILVAPESLSRDSFFYKKLVLVLEHSSQLGARGVILNGAPVFVPTNSDRTMTPPATALQLEQDQGFLVCDGGPLELSHCIVVHNSLLCSKSSYMMHTHHGVFAAESDHVSSTLRMLAQLRKQRLRAYSLQKLVELDAKNEHERSEDEEEEEGDEMEATEEKRPQVTRAHNTNSSAATHHFQTHVSSTTDSLKVHLVKGCCIWLPQQLEGEILAGMWKLLPGTQNFLFSARHGATWTPPQALQALIDTDTGSGPRMGGARIIHSGESNPTLSVASIVRMMQTVDTRHWETLNFLSARYR
jgi:putative AlgH/UPF0301 family transcriptional regulator